MKKFEVGAMYWDTSAVDHECVMVIKITRRTEKSVWFVRMHGDRPDGEPSRTKIFTDANAEYVMPYRYSMAPVWKADRKVELETDAEESADVEQATPETSKNNVFETGKSYRNTFTGNVITITKRTAQFIFYTLTTSVDGGHYTAPVARAKICVNVNGEHITAAKNVFFAANEVADEQAAPETATPDAPQEAANDATEQAATGSEQEAEAGQPDLQETPDAGEPDALEVVRILGGTLNLIKGNGDEVEATKARIALWGQVEEFKRRGVALNVEYDADGRFVGVTEPKANMKFHELPESVQSKVKEYLRAYDDCSVTYERGSYRVSVGVGITARYAPDFKVCGRYSAEDIFTPEERMLNYANSFYSYPPEYCGERDYPMMKAAQKRGAKLAYDAAGNICIAAAFAAGMKDGGKYTILCYNDFGELTAQKIRFHSMEPTTYAQYGDAVRITCTPFRGRGKRVWTLYNKSFAIYEGWQDLPESATTETLKETDEVKVTKWKWRCWDADGFKACKGLLQNCLTVYEDFKTSANGRKFA